MVVGSGCIYPSVVESFAWFLYISSVVIVIVCHAIATDGGVGGVLDHGLCLAWIHVSVSVLLGWWSGSHCVWIHPMVCLVVST